jgi:hypothetical protein
MLWQIEGEETPLSFVQLFLFSESTALHCTLFMSNSNGPKNVVICIFLVHDLWCLCGFQKALSQKFKASTAKRGSVSRKLEFRAKEMPGRSLVGVEYKKSGSGRSLVGD